MFVNHVNDGAAVRGESGMFAVCDRVRLLYRAARVDKVYNAVTGKVWREGVDWAFDRDANAVVRLPGGALPYLDAETVAPPDGKAVYYPAPGANAVPGRVGGGNVLFDAKGFFAEHQIEIDYAADGEQTCLAGLDAERGKRLKNFRGKLARREAVRITALGDSITEGYHSGRFIGFAPYRKPWFELFADAIAEKFAVRCDRENRGINGAGSDMPLRFKPHLLEGRSDLWVIAYGMNDLSNRDAEEFSENLRRIVAQLSAADPAAEFVLVTPMSGNPAWSHTPPERTAEFADAIRKIPGGEERILCGDVHKLWSKVLEVKSFYDLSGNGVNHPNDYAHTIYAAALNALF